MECEGWGCDGMGYGGVGVWGCGGVGVWGCGGVGAWGCGGMGAWGCGGVGVWTMYKNRTILRGSEAYTSKECGACGSINERLGSSITFVFPNCSSVADRDVHAARNILLRFME